MTTLIVRVNRSVFEPKKAEAMTHGGKGQKGDFMALALKEARRAEARGEVPIGAVLVHEGEVIAADGNRTIEFNDPTAHAEILVIRHACARLGSQRLPDCDLYVTLEPCPMCAAAISFARIRRLYYGAADPKGGAVDNGPLPLSSTDLPSCTGRLFGLFRNRERSVAEGLFQVSSG